MVNNFQINIDAKEFLNALSQMKNKFPETARRISLEFAHATKKEGDSGIIPVRTGNLRSTARVEEESNSIKYIIGGLRGSGSPSKFVNYAVFVNNGTSRQSPQFFLERSLNAAASKMDRISQRALQSWLSIMK